MLIPIQSHEILQAIQNGKTKFENGEIIGVLSCSYNIRKSIEFKSCEFKNKIHLSFEVYASIKFSNCKFCEDAFLHFLDRSKIEITDTSIESKVELRCVDGSILNCNGSNINGELIINDSTFDSASFDNITSIDLNSTKFFFQNNTVYDSSFKDSHFHNAIFNKTTFKSKVSFDRSSFIYSIPPASGNYIDTIFEKDVYFNSVVFDRWLFFNGAKFLGSFLLIGMNSDKNHDQCVGDFSASIFYKRSYFDRSSFKSITFKNCEFADVASFKNFSCLKLEISKAIFLKGADFLDSNIINADRETFRIIKNEFLKINNQIESLNYRSKEMKAYELELKNTKKRSEFFLIFLNKISNNHGLSWFRGLCFTIVAAIFFFNLYLFSLKQLPYKWGWQGINNFLTACSTVFKYFIRFIIVTHDIDFMNEFQPSGLSYLIDFTSKIFIGYGIYQTIQAFRKYGKN